MPPVTPSPFRFITKPTKNISKDSTGSSPPPAQFAPTPRFQIPPPTQRETDRLTPFSAPPRLRYNVAEALPNTATATATTRPPFKTPTTHFREAIEEEDGTAFPTSPLHKKRRVGSSRRGEDIDPTSSSPPPTSSRPKPRMRAYDSSSDSEPEGQATQTRSGGHGKRFLFMPAPHSDPSTPTVSHYLRTIRAPQEKVGVPVDWSPRKSRAVGKWAVSGLAAETAGWVVEAQSARGAGGMVTVLEVRRGDGMFIVRGVDEEGGGIRVLLPASPNRGNGLAREVVVGARITYRLPSWEVMLQGEKYKFSAAWRVDE